MTSFRGRLEMPTAQKTQPKSTGGDAAMRMAQRLLKDGGGKKKTVVKKAVVKKKSAAK